MKKILIVARAFSPDHVIGAIRPSKLAKYFSKHGIEVTVLTDVDSSLGIDKVLLKDQRYYGKVVNVKNNYRGKIIRKLRRFVIKISNNRNIQSSFRVAKKTNEQKELKFKPREKNNIKYCIIKIRKKFIEQFKIYEDIFWTRECFKYARKHFKINEFDLVITSYSPASNLLIGRLMKKYKFANKWLADFRDPMIQSEYKTKQEEYYKMIQTKVLKEADYITTVSEGIKKDLLKYVNLEGLQVDVSKIYIVYNGYDYEDLNEIEEIVTKKFSIVYVGGLYNGRRDLRPLFAVLKAIKKTDDKIFNNIIFHYAGSEGDLVNNLASEFEIEEIVRNHDRVSREIALALQAGSDKIVILTWNGSKSYQQGVLPGKLYETMPFKSDVLCLIQNDHSESSELKQLVEKYQLGQAYDINHNERDKIEELLFTKLMGELKDNNHKQNKKIINDFNYENITRKILEIVK